MVLHSSVPIILVSGDFEVDYGSKEHANIIYICYKEVHKS